MTMRIPWSQFLNPSMFSRQSSLSTSPSSTPPTTTSTSSRTTMPIWSLLIERVVSNVRLCPYNYTGLFLCCYCLLSILFVPTVLFVLAIIGASLFYATSQRVHTVASMALTLWMKLALLALELLIALYIFGEVISGLIVISFSLVVLVAHAFFFDYDMNNPPMPSDAPPSLPPTSSSAPTPKSSVPKSPSTSVLRSRFAKTGSSFRGSSSGIKSLPSSPLSQSHTSSPLPRLSSVPVTGSPKLKHHQRVGALPSGSIPISSSSPGMSLRATGMNYPSAEKHLSGSQSSTDPSQKSRRYFIMKELVTTEETYVDAMSDFVSGFSLPLKVAIPQLNRSPLLNKLRPLCDDFPLIVNFHKVLLNRLRLTLHDWREDTAIVGEVFLQMSPFLKIYANYLANHTAIAEALSALPSSHKEFASFIHLRKSDPLLKDNLASYLILPVQRIPRYVLLLNELNAKTPLPHPDKINLDKALRSLKRIALDLNDNVKKVSDSQALVDLQKQLTGSFESVVSPSRVTIKEGDIQSVVPDEKKAEPEEGKCPLISGKHLDGRLYLFNDMLLEVSVPRRKGRRSSVATGPQMAVEWQVPLDTLTAHQYHEDLSYFTVREQHRGGDDITRSFKVNSGEDAGEWIRAICAAREEATTKADFFRRQRSASGAIPYNGKS